MLTQSLVRTVEPNEFVSLDQAKGHLRVDHNQDDAYISGLIVAAREMLELRTNRAFAAQEWRLGLNSFARLLEIPRPPLVSVEAINYLDADEQWQVVDAAVYRVATDPSPGYIYLGPGQSWPDKLSALQSITVDYTAGGLIEQQAYQFIYLMIGNWYENRESVNQVNYKVLPQSAEMLMQQLRVGLYP